MKQILLEHLASLDAAYGIDRGAFQHILEQALDDQQKLEELAEKHSCELPAWLDLVTSLEIRCHQSASDAERVIAETMELDDAVFGGLSKADCIEVLRGLREEIRRALTIRRDAARFLVTIAAAYREGGYPRSEIVDGALKRILSQLTDERGLKDEEATLYVGGLARLCGILPSNPDDAGAALLARLNGAEQTFPDLRQSFAAPPGLPERQIDTGMTFAEIANTVQQIALGLWPAGHSDDPAQ